MTRPITWGKFAAIDPALAAFGEQRLSNRVSYLATIRSDGGPRVYPVTPHFANATCFVYMEPTSPKVSDLERDARYALHCYVENNDGGDGEFGIRGSAERLNDPLRRRQLFDAARAQGFKPRERYVLFELRVGVAFSTTYDSEGLPNRKLWKPSGPVRRVP